MTSVTPSLHPIDRVLDAFTRVTGTPPRKNGTGWQTRCPAHDDRNPSLSINTNSDGTVLLCCHAGCTTEAVTTALNLNMRDLFARDTEPAPTKPTWANATARYFYTDQHGTTLYAVTRHVPKTFRQWHPTTTNTWASGRGDNPLVPYQLPELINTIRRGLPVLIVEGEKDADNATAAGVFATTFAMGAGTFKHGDPAGYAQWFNGADVTIVADRDQKGREHAWEVRAALEPVAARVTIMEPATGKDVTDHLNAGLDLDDLVPYTDTPPDDLDEPAAVTSTWEPVNLTDHFTGDATPETGVILHRSDGPALIYTGRVHLLSGEPEAGKSWLALTAMLETIQHGHQVVFLDLEDNATAIAQRLRTIGATVTDLTHLTYIQPDHPLTSDEIHQFVDRHVAGAALVIIDSYSELLALFGRSPLDNGDVTALKQVLFTPITRTGAALVVLDHVTKNREQRGRWPIGAQAKLASVDVAFALDGIKPFGRGINGQARLTIAKDRPGSLRSIATDHKTIADIHYRSDGTHLTVAVEPNAGATIPTEIMEKVSRFLEDTGPQSRTTIEGVIAARAETVRHACAQLIALGYVDPQPGPRNAVIHQSTRPYRAPVTDVRGDLNRDGVGRGQNAALIDTTTPSQPNTRRFAL